MATNRVGEMHRVSMSQGIWLGPHRVRATESGHEEVDARVKACQLRLAFGRAQGMGFQKQVEFRTNMEDGLARSEAEPEHHSSQATLVGLNSGQLWPVAEWNSCGRLIVVGGQAMVKRKFGGDRWLSGSPTAVDVRREGETAQSHIEKREREEKMESSADMRKASLVKSVSHPLHPYSLLALILSLSKPTLRYMGFLVHTEMNTRNFTVPKQQGRDESSKQDSKTLKQSEALRRIVSSRGPPKIPPSGGPDITN
ncbi:hypothetical protein KFK09_020085 [Dendrobium nobile]|uniref:Uncharacterized protein n=1 Tax=Dendrobium nobile TaxID=94219 RepID=A0A8T3ARV8_DENNO|nr:hypothetical protein KFK09_020085 [Dendrobium nobile]